MERLQARQMRRTGECSRDRRPGVTEGKRLQVPQTGSSAQRARDGARVLAGAAELKVAEPADEIRVVRESLGPVCVDLRSREVGDPAEERGREDRTSCS